MDRSSGHKNHIARLDGPPVEKTFNFPRDSGASQPLCRDFFFKAERHLSPRFGVDDKPGLGLPQAVVMKLCVVVFGVNLNRKSTTRKQKLYEQGAEPRIVRI